MTGTGDKNEIPLTQEEADTLELLDNEGKILERPTGWVIHRKGTTYGLGSKKVIDALTERGYLESRQVTEAGREALRHRYGQLPSPRWKENFQ